MKTKLWLRGISLLLCLMLLVQCCTFVSAAEETAPDTESAQNGQTLGELTEKRTANEKYFLCSDGTTVAAVYADAVHYKDAAGKWQEIDNRLQEISADGETDYANTAGAWSVKFAKKAKENKLVKLRYGNEKLVWYLDGASKTSARASKDERTASSDPMAVAGNRAGVLYENILPAVDLEYLLIGDTLKENIVLKDVSAVGTYTFTYETGAMTMHLADNVITLRQGDTEKLVLNAPVMTDADGNSSSAITLSLQTLKNNAGNHVYRVSVTPDEVWLKEAARSYPVKVDPTLTTPQEQGKIFDTYTDSGAPTTNYNNEKVLKVGTNGSRVYRTYLNFTLPTDIGDSDRVVDARLVLFPDVTQSNWQNMNDQSFALQAHPLTQSWGAGHVSWSENVPAHQATMADYCYTPAAAYTDGSVSPLVWDITQMVEQWYQTGDAFGLMLKADKESGYSGNCVAQFSSSAYDLYTSDNHLAYPSVQIRYMNMLGLEDYWTYHALDAGVGGTAYINDFTGGLSVVTPIASVESAHTPLNVSLVYSPGSLDRGINALNVGNNFMLNLQCYIKPVTIGGEQKYKYVDSDGTIHYFEQANGKWIDDGGLGLTLKIEYGYYKITDKKDNILRFYEDNGRLCNIQDSVGNLTQLYYTVIDGKYYLSSVQDGSDSSHVITFQRDYKNRLSRVVYPDADGTEHKRFAQITYTEQKDNIYHLTQYVKTSSTETPTHIVSFPCDHNALSRIISCPYDADGNTTANGTALIFGYTDEGELATKRRRITSYKMVPYVDGVLQSNNPEYHYEITYHHHATRYTSQIAGDNGVLNEELYLFDSYGRTVSAQDQDGYAAFQAQGISGGAKNKVTFTSDTQHHIANLLKNHSFETGSATTLTNWTKSGGSGDNAAIKGTADSEPTYLGAKSMKVFKNSAAASSYSQVRQSVTLTGGKKYTLSANVYTDFETLATSGYAGAFLCVEAPNYTPQSYTHNIISDGKWSRHFVTIDLTGYASGTYNVFLGVEGARGSAYFDGVQLEEGGSVNSYNLLENASFTNGTTGWTAQNAQSGDGITSGTYSFSGNIATRKLLSQSVSFSGKKGDGFTVGAYVQNGGLPNKDTDHDGSEQDCALTLEITHKDGSKQFVSQSAPNGIDHWQYVCLGAVADEDYTALKLYLKFNHNGGTVSFDNVGLYKDAFGQSFTYDANGNVTSTVDLANNTQNVITNGNNDLTSYKDGKGNEYTFEYDGGDSSVKKHLLTKVTQPNGAKTETTYNSHGLATQSTTTSTGGMVMKSSTAYTADGHYVASETDTADISVRYNHSETDGRLLDVWEPEANGYALRTSYRYDPITKEQIGIDVARDTTTGEDCNPLPVNVAYTYDRGLLTDIVRKADDVKQMGYRMTYDNVGKRTGVYWSGKNDSQSLLQSTTYKPFGAIDTVTYGNGHTLSYSYDNAGLVTEKSYNNTAVAKYDYNANYALGAAAYYRPVTDKWEQTNYFYDLAGRISETKDTRGFTTGAYLYDKNNALTSYQSGIKDAHVNLAYNTKYTYNNLNALTQMSFSTVGGYDSGTMRYGYDGLGRLNAKKSILVAENGDTAEKALTTTFTYKTVTDSSGNTLRTLQPSTTHITDNYNGAIDIKYYDTYHADGSLARTRVTENDVNRYTFFTYDTLGQLTQQYCSYDLNTYNYTYDDGGNLTGKSYVVDTDTVYSAAYTYDSNFSDLLTGYTKTENGVTTTRTYNYTAENGTTFVNPTSIEHRTDGVLTDTWSLTWEQGRQLSSVTTGSTTVRYEYNENGQRVRHQHGNGSVREYYYNGTQLEYIKFFNGNGTLACTLRYIYNANGQAEYILYSAASKASTPASYNLYYILRDNTGVIQKLIKVRSATSSSVSVTLSVAAEYKYDPYGKLLSVTNLNGDSIGTYNPLVYKDYIWDTDTKWYYCNSRYYDPETGRWINADAFVSTGQSITDTNMFMYCGNDPNNNSDSSGTRYVRGFDACGVDGKTKFEPKPKTTHFGAGVIMEESYETPLIETLFFGAETGVSSSGVVAGDISKPVSVFAQTTSQKWRFWEYQIGYQINIGDGGFSYSFGAGEQTVSFSDGSTSWDIIFGIDKIGYTQKYGVDYANHTADAYEHIYFRTIPTAGLAIATYYTFGFAAAAAAATAATAVPCV